MANDYSCTCDPGWQGRDCTVEINECASAACVHGACKDEVAGFGCSCAAGWTGTTCNVDINDCAANPCSHGACTDLVNAHSCACDPGWKGTDCNVDTNECASAACVHGACVDQLNAFACNCDSGWTGKLCDINADDCLHDPCLHGACTDQVAGFGCSCAAGWTGAICNVDVDDCAANPCGHGACTDLVNAHSCACDPGWEGADCNVDTNECASVACVHGACVDQVNAFACNCDSGWTGTLCAVNADDCSPDPCLNGACTDDVANFSCSCAAGWTGTICNVDIDDCAANPCGHGACTDLVNAYSCACDPGWEGADCNIDTNECASDPCVHGACIDEVNAFTCTCDSGWTGTLCDINVDDCLPAPCLHGACADQVASFSCSCDTGWTGTTCSAPVSSSCLQILEAGQSTGDGTYTIDPDGTGPLGELTVYCDMTTDGGGYTFFEVNGGISTNRFDEANTCQTLGLQLLIPRSEAHYESFMALYPSSSRSTVPGIYGTVAANYTNCTMNSFAPDKCANWQAIDGGPWFLRSAPYSEPNGDYQPGCWLGADSNPVSSNFNDGGCGYATGSNYVCSTNDKGLICPAVLAGAEDTASGWASWAKGDAGSGATGICGAGTVASGAAPSRACHVSGAWSAVTDPCIPLTCADGVNGGCGDPAYVTCTDAVPAPRICTDVDECTDGNNGGCGSLACSNNSAAPPSCLLTRPTCLHHLVAGAVSSGAYPLDPDGVGGTPWYWAYCDMTTDGGGWTLVMNIAPRDGNSVGYNNQAFWTGDAEYGSFASNLSNDYKSPAAYLIPSSEIMIASATPGAAGAVTGWRTWPFPSPRSVDSLFTTGIVAVHNPDACETGDSVRVSIGTTHASDDIIRQGTCLHSDVNPSGSGDGDTIRLTTIAGDNTDNQMSGFASCIDCGSPWQGTDEYMGLDRAACDKSICSYSELDVGAARDPDCKGNYCQNWQNGSWGFATGLDWNSRIFVRGVSCGAILSGTETATTGWAHWPVGAGANVSQGVCGSTALQNGEPPTRTCQGDGTWGVVTNPCLPKTCADGVNGDCGDPTYISCVDAALDPRTCVDIKECSVANGGCVLPNDVCVEQFAAPPVCVDLRPSCHAWSDAGFLADGVYDIDPDATGPNAAFSVYCDMQNGGWTLLMKLSAGDFCYGSELWTNGAEYNAANLLDASMPSGYDAKSRAFHQVSDVTELRFATQHGSVTTSFVAPSSPEVLMTTNDIDFAVYPDRTAWREAFLQDRNQAPIFMRAGIPVTTPSGGCRTNPEATPNGCGQVCVFCYQAADGDCCDCQVSGNDVNSGVGNNVNYCGAGTSGTCSTGGSWSDNGNQTLIWGR